jgi:hypothetical protein
MHAFLRSDSADGLVHVDLLSALYIVINSCHGWHFGVK